MDLNASDLMMDNEFDEKQDDVVNISPDEPAGEAQPQLRADEFDTMKAHHLVLLPDLETEHEAISTWRIENWRSMKRKEHGPVFECGGIPWRILFFPYGNNVDCASFYLEHGFEEPPTENWYACVQFTLILWNPNDPTIYVPHTATHRFTADEGDWGFTRFVELRKAFSVPWEGKDRPLVENNTCNVTAYVRIVKDPTGVLWHNFVNYDSKKETGLVGLKNQGATCYLNSLLQSLYFTNSFRKAVYQIPTENEADRLNSAYALQRLFYQLQTNTNAVSTQELTASFGWDNRQIFEQQDVQELSRILMERMEEKMKGTTAQDVLPKLFVGKMKTYISCINVDYESSRIEDFWDLQLNVSGNKNLDDSFKDYIQVETMDGENKYFAEGYGLQDARKGVIFESFPQVLHLQLKRFEYDINRDAMMKVNDRYEFPEKWDASPYLNENADRSEPWTYRLHGVLVHSGDLNAGHYYAFLRPQKDGPFYKFDDDRVTKATMREALEENFGGDYDKLPNGQIVTGRNPYTHRTTTKRSMSAYMLVYIRESRLDEILGPIVQEQTPEHLERKLAEERAARERRRKEQEEAHLYLQVGVVTMRNFQSHQGFDLASWDGSTDDPAVPKIYRILRSTPISDFTRMIAEDNGVDADLVRLWAMVNRQNRTIRPDAAIASSSMTIEEAANKYGTRQTNMFRLWAEQTERRDDGTPNFTEPSAPGTASKPLLIFFKHFDTESQSLKGVKHLYINSQSKVQDMGEPILKMMGWPAGTSLRMYEEIKANMIEPMKPKSSLAASELQDGDIVTFQKSISEKEAPAIAQTGGYTDVRDFYDYLLNRINVVFYPKFGEGTDENIHTVTLSKKMSYDQFSAKVGEQLGVDPTYLRFTTISATTAKPKAVVKRMPNQTLGTILSPPYTSYGNPQTNPGALYYEVLEMSLTEFDTRKAIRFTRLSEGITKEEVLEALVPKNGAIADLIPVMQKKLKLEEKELENIRFYEAHGGKMYKELSLDYMVAGINEFVSIYAEQKPEEEINAKEDDVSVSAFHFDKEPNRPHSVPFKFIVHPGEVFKDTKERLSRRIGIKGKQFEKIKFAVVSRSNFSRPKYLEDNDVLSNELSDSQDMLGLDHVNKSRTVFKDQGIFMR